jgi:hypothetical protein
MLELRPYAVMEERVDGTISFLEAVADEFMERTDRLFAATLKPTGGLTASGITEDVTSILANVNQVLSEVQSLQTGLSRMAGSISSIDLDVGTIISTIEDLPSDVASEVVDEFLNQLSALSRGIEGVGRRVEARFHSNVMQMQGLAPPAQLRSRGIVNEALAEWLETLSGFTFPNVQGFGQDIFDRLRGGFDDLGGGLEDGLQNGMTAIEDGIVSYGNSFESGLVQFGEQLKEGASGGLETLGNSLVNMGINLGNSFKDSATSIAGELRLALVEALATISAPALGMFESFFDTRIAPQLPEVKRTLLPAVGGITIGVLGSLTGLAIYYIRANQRINPPRSYT